MTNPNISLILCAVVYIACSIVYYYGVVKFTFELTDKSMSKPKVFGYTMLFFLINFALFLVYAVLKLSLVSNWLLFFVMLYFQCRFLLRVSRIESFFVSLEVTLPTLTCVLLYRAIASVLFNIPLNTFEDILLKHNFILIYMLWFSYLTIGMILIKFLSKKNIAAIKHLLSAWRQMRFFLVTNVILLIHIFLQAYCYERIVNSFIGRIWAIFTCLYTLAGHISAFRFSIRTSYLYYLDEENIKMFNTINIRKDEEKYLSELIEKDELTNVTNRATGERLVNALIEEKTEFTLCIVDLDGLKYVNDTMGHKKGDEYITSVADILQKNIRHDKDIVFRYGGDEFVIAFMDSKSLDIGRRMLLINNLVLKKSQELSIPMQISYGYQSSEGFDDFETIFNSADKYMYQMKNLHKQLNPKLVRRR